MRKSGLNRRGFIAGASMLAAGCGGKGAIETRVRFVTEAGDIVAALYPDKAPKTVANFLSYVDAGLYAEGSFYRSVRPVQDVNPVPINVIQGGLYPAFNEAFPPVDVETTKQTGLSHTDGVISMARQVPGWLTPHATSEFFICVGDNAALDAGGARNSDGQGFAAFGKVAEGMDVVRAIHQAAYGPGGEANWTGQMLADPANFLSVSRL